MGETLRYTQGDMFSFGRKHGRYKIYTAADELSAKGHSCFEIFQIVTNNTALNEFLYSDSNYDFDINPSDIDLFSR
jgi:hypothetical protein